MNPEGAEAWEDVTKNGRTNSVLCFRMGNAVPKPCNIEEDKKIASHMKNFAPVRNLNPT
jgi:hypothetical protein